MSALKILMLEDSSIDAEIIRRVLLKEFSNIDTRVCMTKETYLEALFEYQPDVILADNSLPQFDAIEALNIVNHHMLQVPFILVTGTVSEEFAVNIIKRGADDYILKDRLGRLPTSIDAALKQRKIEQEKQIAAKQLAESEEKYRTLVDQAFDGIVIYDPTGKILEANHSAAISTGYTQKELSNMYVSSLFFDDDIAQRPLYFDSLKAGKSTLDYRRLKRKDGSYLEMEIGTKMTPDGNFMAVGRDITERKKAEEALQRNFYEKQVLAQRLSTTLNTLPAYIALLDEHAMIMDVNMVWKEFADANKIPHNNYFVGINYLDLVDMFGLADTEKYRDAKAGILDVLNNHSREFIFEYDIILNGEKKWLRMVIAPISEKENKGAVVMHIDISEIRKLEEERMRSQIEEQKKITQAMIQGQENERNAIGRELHDNMNQILAGVNLLLGMLRSKPDRLQEYLPICIENINLAITENRKIAHELVSPAQRSETLTEQIDRLCKIMLLPGGVKSALYNDNFNEGALNPDQKLAVYRIVQEQLTNIVKHAQAKNVDIILATSDQHFSLKIEDDGVGMAPEKAVNGIGIQNMISRLSVLNGTLTTETAPGKGFSIHVEIPFT